ncbi:MAG TPA: hypothetical protein VFE42_20645 [Chloroflexota bacterium]|nr:hypothetical protein [Chloroflexota bacterium]
MARIPRSTPTAVIRDTSWETGETCTIKTYAGTFDKKRLKAAASMLRPDQAEGSLRVESRLAELYDVFFEIGVVAWTITYEDGELVPCTLDGWHAIPEAYSDYIVAEIQKAHKEWEAAAQGPTFRSDAVERDDRDGPGAAGPGGGGDVAGGAGLPAAAPRDEDLRHDAVGVQ